MLIRFLTIALLAASQIPNARSADIKREALYDVVGDFNKDGKPDRAVLILVGPGNSDTSDLEKERYTLSDDEHVDLAIYMGAGNEPLDITKPPSFMKENVVDRSRYFTWAVPLEVNKAGSLRLIASSGWGSTHEDDETLTVQIKDGAPIIIGYDDVWEIKDALSAGCSVDLLKGNAIHDNGDTKKHFKVAAKPIALKDWKAPIWPKICARDE